MAFDDEIEERLREIYGTAQKELKEKWDKYMQENGAEIKTVYAELKKAKQSNDTEAVDELNKRYKRLLHQRIVNNQQFKQMVNQTTSQLSNVNQTALEYINGTLTSVYTIGYNSTESDFSQLQGYSFNLVDENTVEALVCNDELRLPKKSLDVDKDKQWNKKLINSQLTQGIIQGESVDKIANRIASVTGSNYKSALRNARTMTTSVANEGRMNSYRQAKKDGVIMVKVWLAGGGERTRAWHLDLNGVEKEIDEPWENDYGELMYPGDPDGTPGNVYNCRCSMRTRIIGFKNDDGEVNYVKGRENYTQQTEQIKQNEKTNTPVKQEEKVSRYIDGKNAIGEIDYNNSEFDYDIETAMHYQGYDGLPTIVDAEEFDRYVEESSFVAQRTYTAESEELVNEYQDMLYHGKFYVDCSTGGAQYGQGMYCAADYTGNITSGMQQEMEHYISLGSTRAKEKRYSDMMDSITLDNLGIKGKLTQEQLDAYKAYERQTGGVHAVYRLPKGQRDVYLSIPDKTMKQLDKRFSVVYSESLRTATYYSKIETLTLDKSARIFTLYDDTSDITNRYTIEYAKKHTTDTRLIGLLDEEAKIEEKIGKAMYERQSSDYIDSLYADMDRIRSDSEYPTLRALKDEAYDYARKRDAGALAVEMGYDAINAIGHGESGSYTVVLNRTKLIIKGE